MVVFFLEEDFSGCHVACAEVGGAGDDDACGFAAGVGVDNEEGVWHGVDTVFEDGIGVVDWGDDMRLGGFLRFRWDLGDPEGENRCMAWEFLVQKGREIDSSSGFYVGWTLVVRSEMPMREGNEDLVLFILLLSQTRDR